ncbi:putative Prolyl 4-hydroxylase alpha subunit [Cupriavidus taiwanensis]|uniref:Putative Prolyl 4-hydroxylase alpha subunit n=1 Tax=Cupriavidus taiwanensis TaxID=164546 RepID=A0A375IAW8_9BURK|nr:2OG-Fe(II) oxygenase [Cupriavidus taiwanensis]SOY51299.1 putative Prolyl 4-hydroxylase alpha subunit [Cupriavidus taiwanensis]SOY51412.1 putative Prolyl 4-hydroxylase alpha subunit [Cupriavidus taiwanensis]SOY83986.1 putative Prolyl 4-hydroxylase alpha subunit [Cupriavidus taiwanensis]SOZ58283.1 putative Prolyl 4-hydroxylase alpha subunit [Cupriavidus taiwanensis]SOZ79929.1 putative Prolyl 4-hydroxylase alpha subunit [Cupriavidus taiwanensis]
MIREASVAGRKAGYTESSPELEQWLARHIAQGFAADALVLSMLRSGYDDAFARRAVAAAFAQDTGGAAAPARPAPADVAAAGTPAVYAADGGDRQVPVLFRLAAPQVQLFQQLLSDDECDALVALSRGRLARSPVVNPDTGDENLIDARTSMGAMFQVAEHALIARIEARIAAVTGVPAEHGEGLQILNYKPGGEYQPHFDYFNPQRPGEARQLSVGGQRIATLVIYLNTPEAGGATAFPRVGLEVAPVKGNAVYFSYLLPDGTLDDRTLHAGLPVAAGEKWIATKWLRERPYRSAA